MSERRISHENPLLLGSGSPRRRDILRDLGIPTWVAATAAPEDQYPGDTVPGFLERVVRAKFDAATVLGRGIEHGAVLVADTIVVLDGDILGKPIDIADARRLLTRLCGRTHSVWTAYAIAARGESPKLRRVETRVSLRAASPEEIADYAATGEGLDKAGAYAAQGLGVFLIERIDGSYTNVVGLPAAEVIADLRELSLIERFPLSSARAV
jgi:septum formation protein